MRTLVVSFGLVLGLVVCPAAASAAGTSTSVHAPASAGALFDVPLHGGLASALAVIGDRVTPEHARFLVETIRRFHFSPMDRTERLEPALAALVAHLERAATTNAKPDVLPLPLSPDIWTSAVLTGGGDSPSLVAAILRSRSASLLYDGLLQLDEPTRAWLAERRDLVRWIAERNAGLLTIVGRSFRVRDGAVVVPGGASARPVWEDLVGEKATEPDSFLRAMFSRGNGRLPYFYDAVAELGPAQLAAAIGGEREDFEVRRSRARRLLNVLDRVSPEWDARLRPFWRPAINPALFLSDLPVEDGGRLRLPGAERFWRAVFESDDVMVSAERAADAMREGAALSAPWLIEQVFLTSKGNRQLRAAQVLFASRRLARVPAGREADALAVLRGYASYTALIVDLERMGVTDVGVLASAVRRAASLEALGGRRASLGRTQFQSAVAIVGRGAAFGSLPPDALPGVVAALADLEPESDIPYARQVSKWIDTHLRTRVPRQKAGDSASALPVEGDLVRFLAGPSLPELPALEWEGMSYRLDPARAEAVRLERVRGQPPPLVDAARALISASEQFAKPDLSLNAVRAHARSLNVVARRAGWPLVADDDAAAEGSQEQAAGADAPEIWSTLATTLRGVNRPNDLARVRGLVPALESAADDLLARGLMELAYAVAFGTPEETRATAGEVAARHDFGTRGLGPFNPHKAWMLANAVSDVGVPWHVTGSLIGLDTRLGDFSLRRVSGRPILERPSLNSEFRRALIEAATLLRRAPLRDAERDLIGDAVRRGRARVAGLQSAADAEALAGEIRLSASRRTLLPWVMAHEPERLPAFFTVGEIFRAGLNGRPPAPELDRWGAPASARLGCLCLRFPAVQPWEGLVGHWGTGVLVTAIPDLNLRIVELLSELRMPAALAADVIGAATQDLVLHARSRDGDDWRGLVEYVHELNRDRVEEYLALLTTDGPLVPMTSAAAGMEEAR